MQSLKFVLVGGGSTGWTPRLAVDFLSAPDLDGSQLVLVDIDRGAARRNQRYLQMAIDKIGCKWTVGEADLDAALDGADGVCVSISTGGLEAMQNDYAIPEAYGIYHTVGDSAGPAGISRTLRNVPVFIDIARRMERLCPDTWLVHVTNPLAQITRCIWEGSSIRSVGLCHSFNVARHLLRQMFDVPVEDIGATSVGVNHFTWLKDVTCRGMDIGDQLTMKRYLQYEAAKQGKTVESDSIENAIADITDDGSEPKFLLNFYLFERFGYLLAASTSHVAEYLPYYLNATSTLQKYYIGRKGVLPERAEGKKRQLTKLLDVLEGREPFPEIGSSSEGVVPIMEALTTGKTWRAMVNLPNGGQISNLPRGAVVETWGVATANRIDPIQAGPVPTSIEGMLQVAVNEQQLAVEAALEGDRRKVVQAMHVSPLLADKDRAEELANALLAANVKWLPQFLPV